VIEEIRDFLEWGGGTLGGYHRVGCCGFCGRGFDTCGCFFFVFTAAGLVVVDFGLGFLDSTVTLGCEGASVTG